MLRRTFLISAASAAAAVVGEAGAKVTNKLIPYVTAPEQITPGEWTLFATTCRECPAGCGMHVRHRDGRVTKAEGNPAHPVNRGGLCARGQSSLQGLYDPDRVRTVQARRQRVGFVASTWDDALSAIGAKLKSLKGKAVVISGVETGALAEVMQAFSKAFGSQGPILYEPFNYEPVRNAHSRVFGAPLVPQYHLDRCDFILSFSADFLETWISPVEFAYDYSQMRAYKGGNVGRFVYVGSRLSMTAANADECILVPPAGQTAVAVAMLQTIAAKGWARADLAGVMPAISHVNVDEVLKSLGISSTQVESLARRFMEAGASVALAGPVGAHDGNSDDTATAAALLNYAAGRTGDTVDFSSSHALGLSSTENQVREALSGLTANDILFVHNTNPVYALPGASACIDQAGTVVYLGTLADETAARADWILPIDSALESWGDYEPYTGMNGLMQPTMGRLYDTIGAGDAILRIAAAAGRPLARPGVSDPSGTFDEWLRSRWHEIAVRAGRGGDFDAFWQDSLRNGGVWEDAKPFVPKLTAAGVRFQNLPAATPSADNSEAWLWAWAPITLFDGRLANRGWMQEVPEPVSYITWDTWVDIHPQKAHSLGIDDGDMVAIESAVSRVELPVRLTEDVPRDVVAAPLGQGHTAMGANASGNGVNVFMLLRVQAGQQGFGVVKLRKAAGVMQIATGSADELYIRKGGTPVHTRDRLGYLTETKDQHDRDVLQWVPLSVVKALKPGDGDKLILPLPEGYNPNRDVFPRRTYYEHRWAMVVDMQRCIGCGACAAACYAENNVAVVGRAQVIKRRDMPWLRVVPYRAQDNPRRIGWLPLMCQHCDAAPCETVCPVFASVHDVEGLNSQIYNRCIGTRYCSNNCPYKVRKFNWFDYNWRKPLDMQLNPEVTVRCRGVMEKCTFCVQRIRNVEAHAKVEGRKVRDGEIVPACAQTCPTKVYTFGDLLDDSSEVSKLTREDPRRYHVLEDLNTKPAITYLRRVAVDT